MSTSSRSSQAVSVLMVMVVLAMVTGPAMVDAWCPKMGQSCGPLYPCCDCDPNNGGRKLYCDYQWGSGFVCGTYAFEPTCDYGRSCSADGACQPWASLEETVRKALDLPRKLNMN